MKRHLAVYRAVLSLFTVLTAFSVRAGDKPIFLKRGGVPYEDMWKEEDVRKYLNLPRFASMEGIVGLPMNVIASRVEAVQVLAGYQPVEDNNRPFRLNTNEFPVISLKLHGENLPDIRVSVYNYKSWNALCDELFRFATHTVSLWNKIPDFYVSEERDGAYMLTRKGRFLEKWRFDLKKLYMIMVAVEPVQRTQRTTQCKEKAIAEIDKIIRELVGVIEGTK